MFFFCILVCVLTKHVAGANNNDDVEDSGKPSGYPYAIVGTFDKYIFY